jgi:hypothetical protein
MTSNKWKHFERLVAAFHKAADQGADVRWDEKIAGRQFDVTVRFKRGLYEYLTVVECKDYSKPVPVDKVEAFVTKAKDTHANYAVMASPHGFQSGAQDVASRHDMTLIQITESDNVDPSVFGAQFGPDIDSLHISTIELEYTDGERKQLPDEGNVMTYYVNHIMLQTGSEMRKLESVIAELSTRFDRGQLDEYRDNVVNCPSDTRVVAPNDGEIALKPIAKIHVRTGIIKSKTLTGHTLFDPSLLIPDVKVTNIRTGEENTFSPDRLGLGIDTVLEAGNFYENPQLSMYYYCDRIEAGIATFFLVESFQLGLLIQAEITQETKYAHFYVPVTDKAVLQRLKRRLEALKAS